MIAAINWISVTEELPPSDERVLVYNAEDDMVDILTYYREGDTLENEMPYRERVAKSKEEPNGYKRLFILMFETRNVPAPEDGFYIYAVNDDGLMEWRKYRDCITHWAAMPEPPGREGEVSE